MHLFKKNFYTKSYILLIIAGLSFWSCTSTESEKPQVSQAVADKLGITDTDHLSAATLRALEWPEVGNEWYIEFGEHKPLLGDLAYEAGVVRRDPSAVIKVDGKYFVWYSKSTGLTTGFEEDVINGKVFPWDRCDIWYATSDDGWTWKEEGPAVKRGEAGSYDDRSVFTTEIMYFEDKYYLSYQAVKHPYYKRVKNTVGMSWATSPHGPWTKTKEPVLIPADNGEWEGDSDDRFLVKNKGDFDSHKVHDPCILPLNGKFYLYYKGEQMGEEITFGGRQIRHGVAVADNPLGPYTKSLFNPISNSGHEICVWPYNGGVASLITTDGPERNTIQWSPDGVNFEIMGAIKGAPHAIGLSRELPSEEDPVAIMKWGLTHIYNNWHEQSILRFDSRKPNRN